MARYKDILEGLRTVMLLTERVTAVAAEVKTLAVDLRAVDGRLIRVETTFDLLTRASMAIRSAIDSCAPPRLGGAGDKAG